MSQKTTLPNELHPLDVEAAMLTRCVEAGSGSPATNQTEANVFAWAGFVLRCDAPEQAARMEKAADDWFASRPQDELSLGDVRKAGWIRDLPWLRDELTFELGVPL